MVQAKVFIEEEWFKITIDPLSKNIQRETECRDVIVGDSFIKIFLVLVLAEGKTLSN